MPGDSQEQISVVYKFGGSSVRDAERMREVASIICSFPEHLPCVVLSAMGKTTNNLLAAGAEAKDLAHVAEVVNIPAYQTIKALHLETCDQLGVSRATRDRVEELVSDLGRLLEGLCILQDLPPRAKDRLVSFGEVLSTTIFDGYLRSLGLRSKQINAFEAGLVTDDKFTRAEVSSPRGDEEGGTKKGGREVWHG